MISVASKLKGLAMTTIYQTITICLHNIAIEEAKPLYPYFSFYNIEKLLIFIGNVNNFTMTTIQWIIDQYPIIIEHYQVANHVLKFIQ